jgi:hypothetical protein
MYSSKKLMLNMNNNIIKPFSPKFRLIKLEISSGTETTFGLIDFILDFSSSFFCLSARIFRFLQIVMAGIIL